MRVLVFGTFDRLHPGHEFALREAAKRGDLNVIIARDITVQRIKGRLPMQGQEERKSAVQKLLPSARVILGDPGDYLVPVRQIDPDLILLGYDQKLPPGVTEKDFSCPVERLGALKPDRYKTSLQQRL